MDYLYEKLLKPNKILTFLFIIIVVFGLQALFFIKKDVFPLTDIDTMIVQVASPGSSAKDVEVNAVIPIEQEVKKISGIKSYASVSNPGSAIIYLYLDRELNNTEVVKNEIYRSITKENIVNRHFSFNHT